MIEGVWQISKKYRENRNKNANGMGWGGIGQVIVGWGDGGWGVDPGIENGRKIAGK